MTTKPKRVHWTKEERNAVMAAAVTFGHPEVGDTAEVWQRAQERAGLPPNRRRPMDPATAAEMNKLRRKQPVKTEILTAPPPPPKPVEPVAPEPTAPEAPPPAEEGATHSIASLITDVVLRVLYEPRIRVALRNIVAETLAPETELAQVEGVTWREPRLQRERLPRVVVAGGRTFLREPLRSVPGIDLRLWGQVQGESPHRLYSLLRDADHVFVVTSDIPHDVMYGVKSRAKRSGSSNLNVVYWTKPLSELPAAVLALTRPQA